MPIGTFAALCLLAILIAVGAEVVVAAFDGYENGYFRGLHDGQQYGVTVICDELAIQARWTRNVENDLVTSKQDTVQTGAKVNAAIAAAQHYSCAASGTRINGNVYEPPRA